MADQQLVLVTWPLSAVGGVYNMVRLCWQVLEGQYYGCRTGYNVAPWQTPWGLSLHLSCPGHQPPHPSSQASQGLWRQTTPWGFLLLLPPIGSFNINISSYIYRNSHYKDKMVVRPSYLYNGNPYTDKMVLHIEIHIDSHIMASWILSIPSMMTEIYSPSPGLKAFSLSLRGVSHVGLKGCCGYSGWLQAEAWLRLMYAG